MTRIFAAVTLGTVMLIATAAFHTAYASSSVESETLDSVTSIFSTSVEVSALLPIVLLVGLLIASLGVFSRA